jgi:hypothetical protein
MVVVVEGAMVARTRGPPLSSAIVKDLGYVNIMSKSGFSPFFLSLNDLFPSIVS